MDPSLQHRAEISLGRRRKQGWRRSGYLFIVNTALMLCFSSFGCRSLKMICMLQKHTQHSADQHNFSRLFHNSLLKERKLVFQALAFPFFFNTEAYFLTLASFSGGCVTNLW